MLGQVGVGSVGWLGQVGWLGGWDVGEGKELGQVRLAWVVGWLGRWWGKEQGCCRNLKTRTPHLGCGE